MKAGRYQPFPVFFGEGDKRCARLIGKSGLAAGAAIVIICVIFVEHLVVLPEFTRYDSMQSGADFLFGVRILFCLLVLRDLIVMRPRDIAEILVLISSSADQTHVVSADIVILVMQSV